MFQVITSPHTGKQDVGDPIKKVHGAIRTILNPEMHHTDLVDKVKVLSKLQVLVDEESLDLVHCLMQCFAVLFGLDLVPTPMMEIDHQGLNFGVVVHFSATHHHINHDCC